MHIHYSLEAAVINDADRWPELSRLLRDAGVDTIWLYGYFYGKFWSSMEEMKQARETLQRCGFEVGVIQLPVGHPGNSLNPDDDTLELQLPMHWRYRIDGEGLPAYYCADIEEAMIADNAEAARQLRDAGFTRLFMDDDLRLGNWGQRIEGCFCDGCLQAFREAYPHDRDRAALRDALDRRSDDALVRAWIDFIGSRVTRLMTETRLPGMEMGIMVMHLGDERHGIDVAAIRDRIPECRFRVGEAHFGDGDFGVPAGKASELFGVLFHLGQMGTERAYSETTVFPARALSSANFACKAQMAVAAGVPDVFHMSGTWLIDADYWQAFAKQLPTLEGLERDGAGRRSYPVHIAYGTKGRGESVAPALVPLLAGLPARPVRGGDPDLHSDLVLDSVFGLESNLSPDSDLELQLDRELDSRDTRGVLLFFGEQELTDEWERRLGEYACVVFDQAAAERNRTRLPVIAASRVRSWPFKAAESPERTASMLRQLLAEEGAEFPYVAEGIDTALIWTPEREGVFLLNLREETSVGLLACGERRQPFSLAPLEITFVPLG
ncbi:hypothetical protein [Paenibacillus sacheonensis]|uniref:Beta-galactosidase trimerisation domain-containing protein n=1 Tax=Paenibacillus sacheonensis TaxID=742054 RepID=A0A7X4YKT9_9BACL|nr:hypothetical protein [Paenibacillus sacheonensis]MBM7563272.1 hypothetical protein [Paenibacillus sacheonensis]NBC68170.1 hypothetical protein [Paenibacillus sacheonensis]